jgi:hypothetical protein
VIFISPSSTVPEYGVEIDHNRLKADRTSSPHTIGHDITIAVGTSSLNTTPHGVRTMYYNFLYVFVYFTHTNRSWGSSVSIVSDYRLEYRAMEVRFPAGAKDFSSNLCVQTGSGAHPASCPMGSRGPFPVVKRGRGVTLTTHPHLVPRS